MYRTLRAAAVFAAASGLLTMAVSASANEHKAARHHVTVVGNGSSVRLDHATVEGGTVSFKVSTTNPAPQGNGGSTISLFRPKHG